MQRTVGFHGNKTALRAKPRLLRSDDFDMIGVDFSGIRYDMGNKFGILKANIEVGLSHPEVSSQLKDYIKELAKTL